MVEQEGWRQSDFGSARLWAQGFVGQPIDIYFISRCVGWRFERFGSQCFFQQVSLCLCWPVKIARKARCSWFEWFRLF